MTGPLATPVEPRVFFVEFATHKTIVPKHPSVTGHLRVSDQATIDALRAAFEGLGWKVVDE